MDKYPVFIPSRGRLEYARKHGQIWLDEGFETHFVVEPQEYSAYLGAVPQGVEVHPLPRPNQGIGYSRNHILTLADSYGFKGIVVSDDDMRPKRRIKSLVETAAHSKVLGVTARYSYHDLCLGPSIKDRDDLILLPSLTFKMIGLNVQNAIAIGGFDAELDGLEDNDFALRGLESGFPWMIHLGTWSTATGPRYAPGGLSAYCLKSGIDTDIPPWYAKMYERWPDYISGHQTPRIRFSWKKAYNDMLPDWQKWSALHGGYLAYYFGLPPKPQDDFSAYLNGSMQ
jgi:hypothetical protein